MTSIVFDKDHNRFNFRVAGIAISDGHVLVHDMNDDGEPYFVLPGGRVELGESAAAAHSREMREELLVSVDVERPLWLVENFFDLLGRSFHEIGLYFSMTLPPSLLPNRVRSFRRMDGTVPIQLEWRPLQDLHQLPLRPAFLKDKLREPLPRHLEHLVEVTRKS